MLKQLRQFTVRMIAGANIATLIILWLVGYSDRLDPVSHPTLSNIGLLFPVFLLINLGFLVFWLIFKHRFVLIPFIGLLVCYVPVRKYTPLNFSGTPPEGAIKVLSYNTWNYAHSENGPDGVNPIVKYIQIQDADIVCLQEANGSADVYNQMDSLLFPIYAYRDTIHHPNGGNVLALFSKFPIVSRERIPYESEGNFSAAYQLRIGKEKVLLINNHFETTGLTLEERAQFKQLIKGKLETDTAEETSKLLVVKLAESTARRAPQAEAVARYIRQHKGMSTILCGDFNDGPISYAHRTIAKELNDCYVASGNGPGISYHHAGFFVRIDNIMCSDDWKPYGCKIDSKIPDSDHYPIICYLKKCPK